MRAARYREAVRRLLKHLAWQLPLLLLVTAVAGEWIARDRHLDRSQGQTVALRQLSRGAWTDGDILGVDYLPRLFLLDGDGFTTSWGRCDFDQPTTLVFGDSTTREAKILPGDADAGDADDAHLTWPVQLTLDEQVCVVAEDGYHPHDFALIADALAPKMDLVRIVVLLTENDLTDRVARLPVRDGHVTVIYEPPTTRTINGSLWNPDLYAASELFRWIHWKTGDRTIDWETPELQAVGSLTRLQGYAPLSLFYLPQFVAGPMNGAVELESVRNEGFDIQVIELPADPIPLRKQSDDINHMNPEGHLVVAAQVQAAL